MATGAIYYAIGTPGVDEGVTPTITQGTNITSVTGPESDGTIWEGIVVVSDITDFSFSIHCDKYRVYTVDNTSISNWSDAGAGTGVDKVALLEVAMTATPEDLFGYSEGSSLGAFYAWSDSTNTYYTTSLTPAVGDTVYDDTGTPNGMQVTQVMENGIAIAYPTVNVTFSWDGGVPVVNTFSIDNGTAYNVYTGGPQTVTVPLGIHTFTTTGAGDCLYIDNQLITVGTAGEDLSCSMVYGTTGTILTFSGNPGTKIIYITPGETVSVVIGRGNSCCIAYNTPVNYYDGTTKNAEDVRIGDKLLGYDENAQTFVEVEVLGITERVKWQMVHIVTPNHFIDITADHPLLTDRGWAVYDSNYNNYPDLNKIELEYGLKLLTSDGTYEDILSIDYYTLKDPIKAYTFNVTDNVDTYIAAGLVSHNAPEKC